MSNLTNMQKWQKWFTEANATGNLPKFEDAQALLKGANKPAPVKPVPVAKPAFLFELPNNVWPGWFHNNKEHADALPAGADRDAAFANLDRANQLWNIEGQENSAPLTCYPLVNGVLDTDHPILSTISWPAHPVKSQFDGNTYDTSTNAGVLAMCSPRPVPGPNPNAPPFPHPPGK